MRSRMMQNQINTASLLAEIFLHPSEKTVTDRFIASSDSSQAPCTGMCESGACKSVSDEC